jgi:hypothetical protein
MNNRKEHTEKFALNMLGYMFATLGVVILISMLMGCDEDRRCKTWNCKDWDSSGNIEYIEVDSPNQQLYGYCDCIENFDRTWVVD